MVKGNLKRIMFFLSFSLIVCIIFINYFKSEYKSVNNSNFSTAQIAGFEKSIFGSTGWAAIDLSLKESASGDSITLTTISAGDSFMILGVNGSYFEIKYGNYHGYVLHDYCFINLPDVVPSIKYNITNSYSSIYKSSGIGIDGVTGETLYGVNCNNNLCQKISNDGKVINNKIGRSEFIVPSLYSAAKKIANAQTLALNDGYSLMIYDSYRPRSVSSYIAQKLSALYSNNSTVRENIDFSTGASGTPYSWGQGWFLAQGMSSHNVGSAIDVTLFNLSNHNEVEMPTSMHELSTAAIKYYSPSAPKNSSGYSTGMISNLSAQALDNYMINVGMGTLESEWWHFQDNEGLSRLSSATGGNGCDFQTTGILSNYGFSSDFTTVGDVNNDGFINDADIQLIYDLYQFLKDNDCDTCGELIHYSDMNNNGEVDLNDIYLILNSNNDLVTSILYLIGDGYINVGNNNFSQQNVSLKSIQNVSSSVNNNKYLVKYNDEVIKEYDIVSYSYEGNGLSSDYIFGSPSEISADINDGKFSCTNCSIVVDSNNNKVYIKKDINSQQNLREFDLIYITSEYIINGSSIFVTSSNIQDFLSGISYVNCADCVGFVMNGNTLHQNGNFSGTDKFIVKKDDETLIQYNLVFKVSDIIIDNESSEINLELDQYRTYNLGSHITIYPSYASDTGVSWESSNTNVATVNQNGLVTAVGVGNATITVTTDDGQFTEYSDVNVVEYFEFEVKYNNNGIVTSRNYRAGSNIIVSDIESAREGYSIVGWKYDNVSYSLTDTLAMPRYSVTLEAIYAPISSPINYEIEIVDSVKYIKGISLETSVSELSLQLESGRTFKVYDGESLKTTGIIGTGDIIKIYSGNSFIEEYQVVIIGDVNGDGMIKIGDAITIYRNLYDSFSGVSDCYKMAADYNNDGRLGIGDFIKIYKDLFNL